MLKLHTHRPLYADTPSDGYLNRPYKYRNRYKTLTIRMLSKQCYANNVNLDPDHMLCSHANMAELNTATTTLHRRNFIIFPSHLVVVLLCTKTFITYNRLQSHILPIILNIEHKNKKTYENTSLVYLLQNW